MGARDDRYEVTIHPSVGGIEPHRWNALVAADDLPFLEWEWYAALELSGSVSVESGWRGAHIVLTEGGRLTGIAPLYARMDSWGELVFDHVWQRVARHLEVEYFPKLVGMVPATPCTGYRFLIADDGHREARTAVILRVIDELARRWNIKTVAFNFADYRWKEDMREWGYGAWIHHGFSWRNGLGDAFRDFEGYQRQFTKNQRRNIRRERAAFAAGGFVAEMVPGAAAPRRYFDLMHDYYYNTNDKFGPFAAHFLNRAAFEWLRDRFAHRILFSCCFERGQLSLPYSERTPVAMAMLVHKNDALYGRYWGCQRDVDMAHFNVCYYAPIEWAIAHRCRFFDPGLGGEHKLRRGFEADERCTLLRFTDERMRDVLEQNHDQLGEAAHEYTAQLNQARPIKGAGGDPTTSDGRASDDDGIAGDNRAGDDPTMSDGRAAGSRS